MVSLQAQGPIRPATPLSVLSRPASCRSWGGASGSRPGSYASCSSGGVSSRGSRLGAAQGGSPLGGAGGGVFSGGSRPSTASSWGWGGGARLDTAVQGNAIGGRPNSRSGSARPSTSAASLRPGTASSSCYSEPGGVGESLFWRARRQPEKGCGIEGPGALGEDGGNGSDLTYGDGEPFVGNPAQALLARRTARLLADAAADAAAVEEEFEARELPPLETDVPYLHATGIASEQDALLEELRSW